MRAQTLGIDKTRLKKRGCGCIRVTFVVEIGRHLSHEPRGRRL